MLRGLPLSGFKFLQWAPPHLPAWALTLWRWNSLPGQAIHTHKASYAGTTDVARRRLVCPLQSLLLAVLYTRRCGVGGVFQPWGKGLKHIYYSCMSCEQMPGSYSHPHVQPGHPQHPHQGRQSTPVLIQHSNLFNHFFIYSIYSSMGVEYRIN